ncbi:MAG TPA: uracil-DNA glycosylase [Candidatus Wallbacteria bacterium]|nr:uracil-DNA glycosylase [Candidatus Wallbacteria bacterium]
MNPEFEKICGEIRSCFKCPLGKTRNNVVCGDGNLKARLMFIGEAPGAEEDAQGKPFVGRAGQLLTKILEAAGISRDEVFITNILKCRPPDNRKPLPEEMNACKQYLLDQIEVIKPAIIGALGSTSAQFLLGDKMSGTISKIRGKWFDYNETIKLMPLFHPSYLLRNPSKEAGSPKHQMWGDIRDLKKAYDEMKG